MKTKVNSQVEKGETQKSFDMDVSKIIEYLRTLERGQTKPKDTTVSKDLEKVLVMSDNYYG